MTGHTFQSLGTPAAPALGGGIAVFLAGDLTFRRITRIGRKGHRRQRAA